MTTSELIGQVIASYLRARVSRDGIEGTERYLLDCLSAEHTAAVAKAILGDAGLSQLVDIKLPEHFVGGLGLPGGVLTRERTTYFRNARCDKPALLLANTGDDEEQSLKELIPVGAPQLEQHCDLWVDLASRGLPLNEQHREWWQRALQALLEVRPLALDQIGDYVLATRTAIADGHPVLSALGVAFPALRAPRDTNHFKGLNEKTGAQVSRWRNLYAHVFRKRACYYLKQTPAQGLLTETELEQSFDKVKDDIPGELHEPIRRFIAAGSGWTATSRDLAAHEWELVKPLFDGLKRETFNLGRATLDFYDERESDLLTEAERDYLKRLIERRTTGAQEEDEDFFRNHRQELKDAPSLKVRWDRFIYGFPVETEDFLAGIALCLEALFDQNLINAKRRFKISVDRRTKKDLRELNVDAGLFFAARYRGLKDLFGRQIAWDVGPLFEYDCLVEEWRRAGKPLTRSIARSALQIKFFLELEVDSSTGNTEFYSKQLVWRFNPAGVASEFCRDWERLAAHPMVSSRGNRETTSAKGRFESLDLRDVRALLPTFGRERGSLVAAYDPAKDISLEWPQNLARAREQKLVADGAAGTILSLFQTFQREYASAISGFTSRGLSEPALLSQYQAYGALLESICAHAKGDKNRLLLLRPLLQIGTVMVDGGRVTAIVPPWHPLRLAALAVKAKLVGTLMRHLLTAEQIVFGDTRLFFKQLKEELDHPYYPEVVPGWLQDRPELLCVTDHYLDYSLHESPIISGEGNDDTNESPSEAGDLIVDLTKRYLSLYPHEQANLGVVLYNCDSARLPQALVDKLNDVHEDERDMRCEVVLRHRDSQKLRHLYEKIVEAGDDVDSFVASEAARDFMARLRIGIMVDQAPVPDPKDGPPKDIVFLQDVVARHSRLEWYPETANPLPIEGLIPPRWARRRPSAVDDMKSVVYLCCPVQTKEGWAFLTAVTTFFKGDWDGGKDKRLLPARQLDFHEPATASIFKEVHNLGNWVVNYDELLDRRQLLNQNVKVIRYKQAATQGRNLLVSSTAPLGLLSTMVLSRLKSLSLDLTEEEYRALTERLINDANELSGDIVLRAAKRGRNASELMGVVLSRYMIRHEIGTGRPFGWYFLDDYADWLGQREQQIADVLALSPEVDGQGNLRLCVAISEAKYIDFASLAVKRKESQKQLRDTVRRIGDALFGAPQRLDRDLWLSRFSDLILTGIHFSANAMADLAGWRRLIREGNCEIFLRSYSHLFVSGPTDSPECSDFGLVAELEDAYQEVFSRAKLRKLIISYWKDEDPAASRKDIGNDALDGVRKYRKPTQTFVGKPKSDELPQDGNDGGGVPPAPTPLPAGGGKPVERTGALGKPASSSPGAGAGGNGWTFEEVGRLVSDYVPPGRDVSHDEEWLKGVEGQCKGALQQFQLHAKLRQGFLTPNAALLKFQGSQNLTVEQVMKRRSEFLTTHGLNIISVKAEPGLVAISVARPDRQVLRMLEVWKAWKPQGQHGNHTILIAAREEDGHPLMLSPKKHAPHTLIAGSTGSGKSVLMQNIIVGIAATNTPIQAQITLIDPKLGVDYFAFEGLPHIRGGLIGTPKDATQVLTALVSEMDRRYAVLRKNRNSNIFDLNSNPNASEQLPFMWVIHDEFAEWMLTPEYCNAVSDIVARLGVKARAAGIFLVFAAQRPDATVMPMQLRANLGNRLILRVDGEGTSEIALGEKGAERLLGKGHLAAKLEGEDSIITAQVPFVTPEELAALVARIRK